MAEFIAHHIQASVVELGEPMRGIVHQRRLAEAFQGSENYSVCKSRPNERDHSDKNGGEITDDAPSEKLDNSDAAVVTRQPYHV